MLQFNGKLESTLEVDRFKNILTEEAYSHGGLQTRKLGQTPLSVAQPRSEH